MPAVPPALNHRLALALAGATAVSAPVTHAAALSQVFAAGVWEGSIETDLEWSRQSTTSPDSAEIDFALRRLQQKITAANKGFFLYDPRLASGNAAVTLGAVADRQSSSGQSSSSRAGLVGYSFDASILPGGPYSGAVFANRTQDHLTLPFGRSELAFQNLGGLFHLGENSLLRDRGIPFLSGNVRAEQQRIREDTTSAVGQSLQRSEVRNVLGFDAHDGLERGDLDARYEFNDLRNVASPTDSFRTNAADFASSIDFGAGFNRRWDSRLSYYRRDGSSPYRLTTASEELTIDHNSRLVSGYRYVLTRSTGPSGSVSTQDAGANVRYQREPNATTHADVALLRETLPSGTRSQYAAQLAVDYRRSLPWDGVVSAHILGRTQLNDNRLQGSQVAVTDEPQSAPSPLGAGAGFLLNQSFIVVSTIVVVDTRGGARLATAAGVDYDVVQEGNRTRIVPLLTSPVIQAGDPLAVSYVYDVAPSIRYATNSGSFGAGLDLRWIAVSYAHEQSNQHLLGGDSAAFLEDVRKDSLELDLRGAWRALQAQGTLAHVRYDSTFLSYTQRRSYEFASYRALAGLSVGAALDWTRTDFTLPEHRSDARSGRLTLDWYAAGLTFTGLLSRRLYKDSLQPTEVVNELALRSRFEYGKLTLAADVAAGDRTRGGFETKNWRLGFTCVRRF